MTSRKPESSPERHPVSLYLDLWHLVLVIIGVAVVLLLRPFWP